MRGTAGGSTVRGAWMLVLGAALGAGSFALGAAGDRPPVESVKFVIVDAAGRPVGSLDATGLALPDGKATCLLLKDTEGVTQRLACSAGGYARFTCRPERSLLELGRGEEEPEITLRTGSAGGPSGVYDPGASVHLASPKAGAGLTCFGGRATMIAGGPGGSVGICSHPGTAGNDADRPFAGLFIDASRRISEDHEFSLLSEPATGPVFRILDRTTRKRRFELKLDREGGVRLYFYDRGGNLQETLP